jgi:hypothetical protein
MKKDAISNRDNIKKIFKAAKKSSNKKSKVNVEMTEEDEVKINAEKSEDEDNIVIAVLQDLEPPEVKMNNELNAEFSRYSIEISEKIPIPKYLSQPPINLNY